MEAIATCASDESIIKAAQVIISLIDNSLEGTLCGSGDAKSLNIMLAAFELIKIASISGVIKITEEATRAENFILKKAIEEENFEILSQDGVLIKIKTYVDTANNVFCLPKWYFNNLLDDGMYFSKGKKFSGGKKGKKDCFRIALADDWLFRYREQRKYLEKHDATVDANAFIHQRWDTEKYGKEVKNPQIAKIVKKRLQETGQNLD